MSKEVALYLNLKYPEKYTGHCYRRSSATLYVDSGGDITGLKRHGGWKSTTVAEGYIDESAQNKIMTADTITKQLMNSTGPASSVSGNYCEHDTNHIVSKSLPSSMQYKLQ